MNEEHNPSFVTPFSPEKTKEIQERALYFYKKSLDILQKANKKDLNNNRDFLAEDLVVGMNHIAIATLTLKRANLLNPVDYKDLNIDSVLYDAENLASVIGDYETMNNYIHAGYLADELRNNRNEIPIDIIEYMSSEIDRLVGRIIRVDILEDGTVQQFVSDSRVGWGFNYMLPFSPYFALSIANENNMFRDWLLSHGWVEEDFNREIPELSEPVDYGL